MGTILVLGLVFAPNELGHVGEVPANLVRVCSALAQSGQGVNRSLVVLGFESFLTVWS